MTQIVLVLCFQVNLSLYLKNVLNFVVSTSSAGLLMVSNQHLEDGDSLMNLNSSLNLGRNNVNSRKRHKSAGDYHTKPRSGSVFSNWRPRHVSGDDRLQRFSDIAPEEDNLFLEEIDKAEKTEDNRTDDETKDSGVVLDTDNTQDRHNNRPSSIPIETPKAKTVSLNLESPGLGMSIGTPVTENDPLGFFDQTNTSDDNATKTNSNVNGKYMRSESDASAVSITVEGDQSQPMFTIGQEGQDKPECNSTTDNREDRTFSLGSIHSLDSTMDNQPLSPLERVGKRLKDVGRTNSSPGSLDEEKSGKPSFWPVKGYLSSLQSPSKKSQDSLDGTPDLDGNSETGFKRFGSFRKHKERLSGAFKIGAGALANKFSELKHTITTPTKFGSNSSIDVHEENRGVDVPRRPTSMRDTHDGGAKSVPNRNGRSPCRIQGLCCIFIVHLKSLYMFY